MEQPPAIKVLVVDDRASIRALVRRIVGSNPGMEIVGEAVNGAQAIESVGYLSPDVVVMDVEMPVLGGIEATRFIKERWPEVQVLGFTAVDDVEVLNRLSEAGASAHLLKTRASGLLAPLIAAIAAPIDGDGRPDVVVLDEADRPLVDGSN